ncbi:poly(ADP-ribose) glycohydrolase-like isoform X2 [Cloeon dipterum]|uniref:poly(ADP-ribose) glycohydrolase-like isoform X2 n=1 Tax=Cloeon dipterum TaxID=197152 RepID=UPI00321FEA20
MLNYNNKQPFQFRGNGGGGNQRHPGSGNNGRGWGTGQNTFGNAQRSFQINVGSIRSTGDLETFIRSEGRVPSWDFAVLHDTFRELDWLKHQQFTDFVSGVVTLAESQDHLVLQERFRRDRCVELSRHEVSVLLANAFLCRLKYTDHKSSLNFNSLYSSRGAREVKKEKLKCLVLYLYFVLTNSHYARETVTYRKVKMHAQDENSFRQLNFADSQSVLSEVDIIPNQSLSEAKGVAQVDFANKGIGGGVLSSGSLQEEIKFITCPELLVSKLFPDEMRDDEAIIVENARFYIQYTGYANSFRCVGLQPQPLDFEGPLLAIDATDFSKGYGPNEQYQKHHVMRELKKAYVGFSNVATDAIATGNWGGGAFKGDAELKFKIQWLAASLAGKKLVYYPYTSDSLKNQIHQVVLQFRGHTTRDLCSSLNLKRDVPITEPPRGFKRQPEAPIENYIQAKPPVYGTTALAGGTAVPSPSGSWQPQQHSVVPRSQQPRSVPHFPVSDEIRAYPTTRGSGGRNADGLRHRHGGRSEQANNFGCCPDTFSCCIS